MAQNAPKLAGFTFTHHPKATVYWEPQLVTHKLSDGCKVVYNKGFILKGVLEWGSEGWLNQEEYSAVMTMYNQLTGSAHFYPKPDTYTTRKFVIHFTNDFNFTPHGAMLGGNQLYEGSIEFESSIGEITATASEIY